MTREEARVQALGALYSADALRMSEVDVESLSSRAAGLAQGAWSHRADLDRVISEASSSWRIERMPAVDRAVLRLAAFELIHTTTPKAVVISEAVELAKRYSTARSGAFVNGVLSAIGDAESHGGAM